MSTEAGADRSDRDVIAELVMLASLAVLAVLFVAAFLPETKHMSLEDVTAAFEKKATRPSQEQSRT